MRRARGNAYVTSADNQENLLSGTLRIISGIRDDHPIAVEAPAQKLIGRTPEIQTEAAVVDVAKSLHHGVSVMKKFGEFNYRRFRLYLWGAAYEFLSRSLDCYRMIITYPADNSERAAQ